MGCGQVYTMGEGVEMGNIAAPSGDLYPRSGYSAKDDMILIANAPEGAPYSASTPLFNVLLAQRDALAKMIGGASASDAAARIRQRSCSSDASAISPSVSSARKITQNRGLLHPDQEQQSRSRLRLGGRSHQPSRLPRRKEARPDARIIVDRNPRYPGGNGPRSRASCSTLSRTIRIVSLRATPAT